jgi:hypothetical protein
VILYARPYISVRIGGQAQVGGCDNVLHSLPFDGCAREGHTSAFKPPNTG